MVKTFLDVEPPYLPNAHNKRVMLDYLSENQLPLNLASLKTAFAALKVTITFHLAKTRAGVPRSSISPVATL